MKTLSLALAGALALLLLSGCSTTGGVNFSTGEPHFNGFIGTTLSR